MRVLPRIAVIVALFCALTALEPAAAQDSSQLCTPFIEQALAEVGSICSGLERNSVCYGFNRVDATFNEAVAPDFFSQPADRAALIDLAQLSTVALSPEQKQWGVAVMNVQANVPGTLPGQAVTFVLVGDATLENTVPAAEARTELADPIEISAATNANIRSGPGINANVVGGVVAGTLMQADGVSSDLGWLRILYADAPAWISRSVVGAVDGLDSLPVVQGDWQTPMQAFYFRTGTGQPQCTDFPPAALVIQGPERVDVNLTMNGAAVTVGSTIVLTQPDANTLKCIVVDGAAHFPSGLTVPTGFAVEATLNADGEVISTWGGFHALTDGELSELAFVELLPDELFHYPVKLPTRAEIQAIQNAAIRAQATAVPPTEAPPAVTAEPTISAHATQGPPADFDPNDIYVTISADPQVVNPGQCTTIFWNTRNVREVWFEGQPNIGTNSAERCPERDSSYTIQVFYYDGTTSSHTVTVDVLEPTPEGRQEPPCTEPDGCDDEEEIS